MTTPSFPLEKGENKGKSLCSRNEKKFLFSITNILIIN